MYHLCKALDEAVEMAGAARSLTLNNYQRKAVDLLTEILSGNVDVPMAAVQGPPGTGKTTVVEAFVEQKGGLADFILQATVSDEVIIYTAPTNHLAWDAFRRVTAALLRKGFDVRDIIDLVRVYGSKIRPCESSFKPKNREVEKILDSLDRLMSREIDVSIVKLVFTVEFQRVSSRFTNTPSRMHFIVDEASKTPFYRFFLPIADAIIKRPGTYPASLMVLGDPEQAITVPEEFRVSRVKLLMRKVMDALRQTGLEDQQHVLLSITYRLPRPSEEPISHGYYGGRLHSYYTLRDRKRLYELLDIVSRERSKIEARLQTMRKLWDDMTKKLLDAIVEAYASDTPLIVIQTSGFQSKGLPTLDPRRVELAVRIAAIFAVAMDYANLRIDAAVTAPYSDMVATAAYRLRDRLEKQIVKLLNVKPLTATVQSMIGGEADVIITMLGKEWGSGGDYFETIYEREPEVLNVQLSRHRGLEIVIGDVKKLSRFSVRKIARTAYKMLELHDSRKEAVLVSL